MEVWPYQRVPGPDGGDIAPKDGQWTGGTQGPIRCDDDKSLGGEGAAIMGIMIVWGQCSLDVQIIMVHK